VKTEKFEFKMTPENPLLFPREGGRGMSSKTASHKNYILVLSLTPMGVGG
jgi:hypothetical protein